MQIYEVGCLGGFHFIAQEYVPGHNLHELIGRCGPPDMPVALAIMRQATDALRKASEQGIVHRDIKPENIMIAENGEVKVADFGLARLLDDHAATNLTQTGFTMGTPLYMSPEQVEGRPLDPRSDIYSLGVTFYQMLAGETPFKGETALSVAVQHLQKDPPPLETIRTDLPASLCHVIHRMLAKEASERYETARLLLKDLRTLAAPISNEEEQSLIEGWASQSGPTLPSRKASTARLSTLMATARQPVVARRDLRLFAVGLVACFALGLGVAWATRPVSLLAHAGDALAHVERRSSAEAQYVYALMAETEEGWQSVVEYFPTHTYFVRRAEQQLARLYMQQDDYPRALALFQKFADMDDTEEEFKAFGLAGVAAVLSYQGHPEQAAHDLAELWPLRQHLDSQTRVGDATDRPQRPAAQRHHLAKVGSMAEGQVEAEQPALAATRGQTFPRGTQRVRRPSKIPPAADPRPTIEGRCSLPVGSGHCSAAQLAVFLGGRESTQIHANPKNGNPAETPPKVLAPVIRVHLRPFLFSPSGGKVVPHPHGAPPVDSPKSFR